MLKVVFAAVILLLSAAILASSCATKLNPKSADAVPTGFPFSALSMKESSANPYSGQYAPWDKWILEHQRGVFRGAKATAMMQGPTGTEVLMVSGVTEDGFLMPYMEYERRMELRVVDKFDTDGPDEDLLVVSIGDMPQELQDATHLAADEVRSAFYREIPRWLVDLQPERSVLLPNGEIAARIAPSKLGFSADDPNLKPLNMSADKPGSGDKTDSGWARYAADGQLLGYTRHSHWWYLYFDIEVDSLPAGELKIQPDGYAVIRSENDRSIIAIYDFDGTRLDAFPEANRDTHYFHHLMPRILTTYYSAQQRSKKYVSS